MSSIGVVVAHDDKKIVEEIAEHIEGAPDLFVAGTTGARGQVIVAGGEALITLRAPDVPVIALAESRDLRAARAALEMGARDLVEWPGEAERLAGAIRRAARQEGSGARSGGCVIAVAGARGGIGATTISAIMARALDDAVLIDLDVVSAGQRAFCAEEPARTLGSLRSSLADLSPDALLAALSPERVLHGDPGDAPLSAAECNGVVRAARALGGPVVLDCGRANDPAARAVAANADVRALVVSDDVASVRAMRPFLDLGPCALVIRRARRDGVSIRDIEAAAGTEARVVVRVERALSRAADLGELPQRPTRAMRALTRLAHELVEARA